MSDIVVFLHPLIAAGNDLFGVVEVAFTHVGWVVAVFVAAEQRSAETFFQVL